jgi:hypothetical protein
MAAGSSYASCLRFSESDSSSDSGSTFRCGTGGGGTEIGTGGGGTLFGTGGGGATMGKGGGAACAGGGGEEMIIGELAPDLLGVMIGGIERYGS